MYFSKKILNQILTHSVFFSMCITSDLFLDKHLHVHCILIHSRWCFLNCILVHLFRGDSLHACYLISIIILGKPHAAGTVCVYTCLVWFLNYIIRCAFWKLSLDFRTRNIVASLLPGNVKRCYIKPLLLFLFLL